MTDISGFEIHGTAIGKETSIKLDEISILGCPETIKAIGEFLVKAADRMICENLERMHLQDIFYNFSSSDHVDIIALNGNLILKV